MEWFELGLLDELGFSIYEKKALASIALLGVADAATLCREGEIPSSKIYLAMEKLAELGVVQIQPTRPKLFSIGPADVVVDRLIEVARQRAEDFASRCDGLREALGRVQENRPGRETFADLALGSESHVKRHLVHLAEAQTRVLSYLEDRDLEAIGSQEAAGFRLLRRIGRNAQERQIDHRLVFGFRYATGARLTEFLRQFNNDLAHATGVRFSGELGHPFHVIDDEIVILSIDHPFVGEGRLASLLVRDHELASQLASGFETLWTKAMRDLREIRFQPRAE